MSFSIFLHFFVLSLCFNLFIAFFTCFSIKAWHWRNTRVRHASLWWPGGQQFHPAGFAGRGQFSMKKARPSLDTSLILSLEAWCRWCILYTSVYCMVLYLVFQKNASGTWTRIGQASHVGILSSTHLWHACNEQLGPILTSVVSFILIFLESYCDCRDSAIFIYFSASAFWTPGLFQQLRNHCKLGIGARELECLTRWGHHHLWRWFADQIIWLCGRHCGWTDSTHEPSSNLSILGRCDHLPNSKTSRAMFLHTRRERLVLWTSVIRTSSRWRTVALQICRTHQSSSRSGCFGARLKKLIARCIQAVTSTYESELKHVKLKSQLITLVIFSI